MCLENSHMFSAFVQLYLIVENLKNIHLTIYIMINDTISGAVYRVMHNQRVHICRLKIWSLRTYG